MNEYAYLPAYTDPNLNAGTFQAANLGRLADQSKLDAELKREENALRMAQAMNADKQAQLTRDQRGQEHAAEMLLRSRELDAQQQAEKARNEVLLKQVQGQIDLNDPTKRAASLLETNKSDFQNLARTAPASIAPLSQAAQRAKAELDSENVSATNRIKQLTDDEKKLRKAGKIPEAEGKLTEITAIKRNLEQYKLLAANAQARLDAKHAEMQGHAARLGVDYDRTTGAFDDHGKYTKAGDVLPVSPVPAMTDQVVEQPNWGGIMEAVPDESALPVTPVPTQAPSGGLLNWFAKFNPFSSGAKTQPSAVGTRAASLGFPSVAPVAPASPVPTTASLMSVDATGQPQFTMPRVSFGAFGQPTFSMPSTAAPFVGPVIPTGISAPPATATTTQAPSLFSARNPFAADALRDLGAGIKGRNYYLADDWEKGQHWSQAAPVVQPAPWRPIPQSVIPEVNENIYNPPVPAYE